jgi:hypothetical protein
MASSSNLSVRKHSTVGRSLTMRSVNRIISIARLVFARIREDWLRGDGGLVGPSLDSTLPRRISNTNRLLRYAVAQVLESTLAAELILRR